MTLTCPVGETIVRLCSLIGVRLFLRLLVRHCSYALVCDHLCVQLLLCDYMSDLLSSIVCPIVYVQVEDSAR